MKTRHMLSVASAVVLLAALGPPANATAHQCEPAYDSYNCLLMSGYHNGWRNVMSLTYCYATKPWSHTFAGGKNRSGFPLPQQYRTFVDFAADTWSTTPGLRISLSDAGACTAKTDIRIYGEHGHAIGESGDGGCFFYNDGKYNCSAGAGGGFIFLSVDVPIDDDHMDSLKNTAVHEFGHVLGLDHPCDNKCEGPVMSYKTCPYLDDCPYLPNYDDIVGMQVVYGWHDDGGGCGLAVQQPDRSEFRLAPPPSLSVTFLDDRPKIGVGASEDDGTMTEVTQTLSAIDGVVDQVSRVGGTQVDPRGDVSTAAGSANGEVAWALDQAGLGALAPDGSTMPVACFVAY